MDALEEYIFTCMCCGGSFKVTEGTWPQNDINGHPMLNADYNDRAINEFVCYDCAD